MKIYKIKNLWLRRLVIVIVLPFLYTIGGLIIACQVSWKDA